MNEVGFVPDPNYGQENSDFDEKLPTVFVIFFQTRAIFTDQNIVSYCVVLGCS